MRPLSPSQDKDEQLTIAPIEEVWEELFRTRPEVKTAYEALQTEYDLIEQEIQARIQMKLTQAELARRAKTKQSAISRFEKRKSRPTLSSLRRIAAALDMQLEIRFVPKKKAL